MKIILASKSPRRKEILEKFGYKFSVNVSDVKEEKIEKFDSIDSIEKVIIKNAANKAKQVLALYNNENTTVISADTTVVLDSVCLNKPRNKSEAFLCLKQLSNKTHKVLTAVSVCKIGKIITKIDKSEVSFRKLDDNEIKKYIDEFNPLDKAGSYGIQDFIKDDLIISKDSFIKEIKGSYYNIMGICPYFLSDLLEELNS